MTRAIEHRRPLVGLGAAVALLAATPALAADAGHGGGIGSLFPYVVNFVLFLALLYTRLRRPVADALVERRQKAVAELEGVRRAKDEAEAELRSLEARVSGLDAEVAALLGEAQRMAEAERDRLLEAAQATADRIQREAAFTIEQEVKRARLELEREVAAQAAAQAEAALRQAVTAEDQDRFVREFVEREVAS